MLIIRKRTYARAGLLGNPSDGYNGKTIALSVRNLWSEVVLYEWDTMEIVLAQHDRARFSSIQDLAQDVKLHGYYGGIRLVKATIKRFVEYCNVQGITLHKNNFSIRYASNIPRQVGLAGSSSIITSTLRCLLEFYDVEIPLEIQPSFVLSIETEELGITAGLQDRVIQVYEGLVYMDFDRAEERELNGLIHYAYEPLTLDYQPPLYIAYHTDLSEPTETFHNDIRGRYDRGEEIVVQAMDHWADLTVAGREALVNNDMAQLHALINENYDTRANIYRLPDWQALMVETARSCGASAKFAGSGGTIVGTYDNEDTVAQLCEAMEAIGSTVVLPQIFPAG